ncbi:MAG: LolA family protein, partial [Bacteroidota bacterium]
TASFDMNGQELRGNITMKQKAPGKQVMVMDFKMFKQTTMTDGNQAWRMMGPQSQEVTDNAEKQEMLDEAHIAQSARLLELGYTLTIKGQEGSTIIVEAKNKAGEVQTLNFDAKTYLLNSIKEIAKSPQGEVEVTRLFGNYIDVGGVKFPAKMVIEQGPLVISFDDISYKVNQEINDSEFKPE